MLHESATDGADAPDDRRGRVLVHDVDEAALRAMRPRLARARCDERACGRLDALEPSALRFALGGGGEALADVVLVDAPCSQLGTLRRGPGTRWELVEAEAAGPALPSLQLALLLQAAALVRPGGLLVYATCTLRAAENDEVCDRFEAAAAAGDSGGAPALLRPSPLAEAWGDGRSSCLLYTSPSPRD